ELKNFDLIIGLAGLKKMKTKLDLENLKITFGGPTTMESLSLNYIVENEKHQAQVDALMKTNKTIDKSLPYTTRIIATIRTKDDKLIWSKQYPYRIADHEFVNQQIDEL
ncbi:hypothetical protein, partial [Nocardia blacklockiae]|uniref:hypothetical protein n=1 Tax=Nocardia blacklockiae TaxID=480036 RepID=UPI001893335E